MGKDTYSRQPADNSEQGCASKTQRNTNNEPKEKVTAKISFRIAVFYDGTGNNKLNTDARREVQNEFIRARNKQDDEGLEAIDKDLELEKELENANQQSEIKPKEIEEAPENDRLIKILNDRYPETYQAYNYLDPKMIAQKIIDAKENFRRNKTEYEKSKTSISYLGAETNIYKMFRDLNLEICEEPKPRQEETAWVIFQKFYIEGIGTFSGADDGELGGGLARGDSGITMRVKQARDRVCNFIRNKVMEFKQSLSDKRLKEIQIENIYLDFFGFSRGAACARYSCKVYTEGDLIAKRSRELWENIKPVKEELNSYFSKDSQIKLPFENIIIKNIGIFDTVASHGLAGTIGEKSDAGWLSLNSITKATGIVYHITAENEYRENFALTNNNSKPGGISMPGAHSDIGGGYEQKESENHKPIVEVDGFDNAKSIAFWFKENGWAKLVLFKLANTYAELKNENVKKPLICEEVIDDNYSVYIHQSNPRSEKYTIYLNRPEIFNDYSKIPLNKMIDEFAQAVLIFDKTKSDVAIKSPESLNRLVAAIQSGDIRTINEFRLKFMHFSASAYRAASETDAPERGAWDKTAHKIKEKITPYKVREADIFESMVAKWIFNKKMPFYRKVHDG